MIGGGWAPALDRCSGGSELRYSVLWSCGDTSLELHLTTRHGRPGSPILLAARPTEHADNATYTRQGPGMTDHGRYPASIPRTR